MGSVERPFGVFSEVPRNVNVNVRLANAEASRQSWPVKAADPWELKVEELREGVADEERRLAELGEEMRRAQSRLAALRSDQAVAEAVRWTHCGVRGASTKPTWGVQLET